MVLNKLFKSFMVIVILICFAADSFASNIVVGKVIKVNVQEGEVVLKINNSKREFNFSKNVKIYHKSFKDRLKWPFLKSNLIPGTKIKAVTNGLNNIMYILIMEIPQ